MIYIQYLVVRSESGGCSWKPHPVPLGLPRQTFGNPSHINTKSCTAWPKCSDFVLQASFHCPLVRCFALRGGGRSFCGSPCCRCPFPSLFLSLSFIVHWELLLPFVLFLLFYPRRMCFRLCLMILAFCYPSPGIWQIPHKFRQ